MKSVTLFSGKTYIFDVEGNLRERDSFYKLISDISKDHIGESGIHSIKIINQNLNFDEFLLKTKDGDLFSVKISMDEDSPFLNNEYKLLKNNDSVLLPRLYGYDILKEGLNVRYLITSFEDGYNLYEEGISSMVDNSQSFFYTQERFSSFSTENSFFDYIDLFFKYNSIEESSDFFKNRISKFHKIDDLFSIFSQIKEEIYFLYDKETIEKNLTCHGDLKGESVVSRWGLYKFKNLNFCYKGNPIFDLCSLSLDVGLSYRVTTFFFKKYCLYHDLDFDETKKEFNKILKMSSLLHLYELLIKYLSFESLYTGSRERHLHGICLSFHKSLNFFHQTKVYTNNKDFIYDIFTKSIEQPLK